MDSLHFFFGCFCRCFDLCWNLRISVLRITKTCLEFCYVILSKHAGSVLELYNSASFIGNTSFFNVSVIDLAILENISFTFCTFHLLLKLVDFSFFGMVGYFDWNYVWRVDQF